MKKLTELLLEGFENTNPKNPISKIIDYYNQSLNGHLSFIDHVDVNSEVRYKTLRALAFFQTAIQRYRSIQVVLNSKTEYKRDEYPFLSSACGKESSNPLVLFALRIQELNTEVRNYILNDILYDTRISLELKTKFQDDATKANDFLTKGVEELIQVAPYYQ